MKIISDIRCTEYSRRGHPERPERIGRTLEKLKSQNELTIDWVEPLAIKEEALLRAHAPEHLEHVRSPQDDFDADTPAYPGIFDHARRSAGGALKALELAKNGDSVFSLLRPPGHHATRDRAMGFCFLNSIAIAALEAAAGGSRVAVFDFDVHHGNVTEAILYENPACAYFSVHQYPAYPGTGTHSMKNCFNHPVPPRSSREVYRAALSDAMDEVKQYKPDLLAVSAGFDAYRGDPLAEEPLEAEDFHWLGESVRKFGIPVFSVLEGGYSNALPDLILAYLKGLSD